MNKVLLDSFEVCAGFSRIKQKGLKKLTQGVLVNCGPVFLPERDAVRLSQLVAQIVHVDH